MSHMDRLRAGVGLTRRQLLGAGMAAAAAASHMFGGAADTGWTAYPPLSVRAPFGQTLWLVGVLIVGTSSILGGAPSMGPTSGCPCPRFTQSGEPMRYPRSMAATFTRMTPM